MVYATREKKSPVLKALPIVHSSHYHLDPIDWIHSTLPPVLAYGVEDVLYCMKRYVLIYVMMMFAVARSFLQRSVKSRAMARSTYLHTRLLSNTIKFDKDLLQRFFKSTSSKNFEEAKKNYDEMIRINPLEAKKKFLAPLLHACESEEQMAYGEQFINELELDGIPIDESVILPRIRMKCSQGKPSEAMEFIRAMQARNISPKLRDFAPIIDAYCQLNTIDNFMTAMNITYALRTFHIYPRSEQLLCLVQAATRLGYQHHPDFYQVFHGILEHYQKYHYGILHTDAIKWVQCFMNISERDVHCNGSLASSVRHIPGRVISEETSGDGTHRVHVSMHNSRHLHGGIHMASIKDDIHAMPTEYPPFGTAVLVEPQVFTLRNRHTHAPRDQACITYISPSQDVCPNCEDHLCSVSSGELGVSRISLRQALKDYFLSVSKTKREMQNFEVRNGGGGECGDYSVNVLCVYSLC